MTNIRPLSGPLPLPRLCNSLIECVSGGNTPGTAVLAAPTRLSDWIPPNGGPPRPPTPISLVQQRLAQAPPAAQPGRLRNFLYQFIDSNITPAQTRTLFRWNAGGNLAMNIFSGGFGLNLDTLASVAGVASMIPGLQFLMIPVAGYYLGKALLGIGKALIFDTLFGNGFDLGNILQSVAFGALSAMMVLPFGKIGQIRQLFANFNKGEAFRRAVTLCYGREVTASGLRAVQTVRGLGQRGAQAAQGGQGLGIMERFGQWFQGTVNRFNAGRNGATPQLGFSGGTGI